MKKIVAQPKVMLAMAMIGLSLSALAESVETVTDATPNKPNMLLYIQPYEYTNPLKFTYYSEGYWFTQGPIVEPLAKEKLTQAYGNVDMCEGNQSGKTLVWLQPKMFYNPQAQIFYGEVTANVYTGIGKLVGTYAGKSAQHGFLNIKPDYWLEKAYATAINDMVAKMQADSAIQTAVSSAASASAADTPCSMVTLLPIPKVRTMFF
jgi:hypothetical protein